MKEANSKDQNNEGAQCSHSFTDLQILKKDNVGIPSSPTACEHYTEKILAPEPMQAMSSDTHCLHPGQKYFGYMNYKYTSA